MRKIASAVAVSVALLGIGAGVSQAATVPPGTPAKAVVAERNVNDQVTEYQLKDADPMSGRFGDLPLGDASVWAVKWTKVSPGKVIGTGKYAKQFMDSYASGPVTIAATGSGYSYTKISVTLTQSWYGTISPTGKYPPYGKGAHHTTKHIHLAVNDPTTNLDRES